MKLIFSVFIYVNIVRLSSAVSCHSKYPKCKKDENIVCIREGKCGPVPGCQELDADPEFLKFILYEHNRLRNNIASGNETRGYTGAAANMQALSYDLGLESTARCHVNRCLFDHDKCRGTTKFKLAGQNLFYTTASEDDLKNAVTAWYDEINLVTPGVIDSFPKGRHDIGHFTQVIWATTTHVGCAKAKSFSEEEGEQFYITCNYAPTGNMINKPIYVRGEGCSQCPPNTKCNTAYPALCGDIDETDIYAARSKADEEFTEDDPTTSTISVTATGTTDPGNLNKDVVILGNALGASGTNSNSQNSNYALGPNGTPVLGPNGTPLIGPDGKYILGSSVASGGGQNGNYSLNPNGTAFNGQNGNYLLGPDGNPVIGPDGKFILAPNGASGNSGSSANGQNGNYVIGPNGQPIIGPDGKYVLASDATEQESNYPVGPSGNYTAGPNGTYIMGPNSTYVITPNGTFAIGDNGTYVIGDNGDYLIGPGDVRVILPNNNDVIGPNGTFIVGLNGTYVNGPNGTQVIVPKGKYTIGLKGLEVIGPDDTYSIKQKPKKKKKCHNNGTGIVNVLPMVFSMSLLSLCFWRRM